MQFYFPSSHSGSAIRHIWPCEPFPLLDVRIIQRRWRLIWQMTIIIEIEVIEADVQGYLGNGRQEREKVEADAGSRRLLHSDFAVFPQPESGWSTTFPVVTSPCLVWADKQNARQTHQSETRSRHNSSTGIPQRAYRNKQTTIQDKTQEKIIFSLPSQPPGFLFLSSKTTPCLAVQGSVI